MTKQVEIKPYDGSEMDDLKAPPLKMISSFFIIAILGFMYALTWGFLLK